MRKLNTALWATPAVTALVAGLVLKKKQKAREERTLTQAHSALQRFVDDFEGYCDEYDEVIILDPINELSTPREKITKLPSTALRLIDLMAHAPAKDTTLIVISHPGYFLPRRWDDATTLATKGYIVSSLRKIMNLKTGKISVITINEPENFEAQLEEAHQQKTKRQR